MTVRPAPSVKDCEPLTAAPSANGMDDGQVPPETPLAQAKLTVGWVMYHPFWPSGAAGFTLAAIVGAWVSILNGP